jgi:hypothetical protein
MATYLEVKKYAKSLGSRAVSMDLIEFSTAIRQKFNIEIDTSFMKYSLKLLEMHGFTMHHGKLFEYGITKSCKPVHAKEKFDELRLIEGDDYELRKGSYYLSSRSFKKCLLTAEPNQTFDPTIYIDYFLLLERIYGLYVFYQQSYREKIISTKGSKINELLKEY